MRLCLTSGCPDGNGSGGPRPVYKVRHLPDIPLIIHFLTGDQRIGYSDQVLQRQSKKLQMVQQRPFRFVERVSDLHYCNPQLTD